MDVTDDGIDTFVNLLFVNALPPMEIIEDGILTEFNELSEKTLVFNTVNEDDESNNTFVNLLY